MSPEISTTRGRNFCGTVGLKAGYGSDGQLFERSEIVNAWQEWVKERHAQGKPYLGVVVGPVEDILYGFETDSELKLYSEPIVAVRGEVASYQEHLNDEQVVEVLSSLFEFLGKKFLQTTVRFLYSGDDGYRCSFRLRFPNTEHPLD